MQVNRDDINKNANPFIALEGTVRELSTAALISGNDSDEVIRIVRGQKCHTKQAFFDEVSAAFQFPLYFGGNWDAFEECMNDLGQWLPVNGYLVIISDAEQLLSDEPLRELDVLMEVLERAAFNWSSGANRDRLDRAIGEHKGDEEVRFAVALQISPDADLATNLGAWLSRKRLPRAKLSETR